VESLFALTVAAVAIPVVVAAVAQNHFLTDTGTDKANKPNTRSWNIQANQA